MNLETGITFMAGDQPLEGLYRRASNSRAVVVTHPHPLYGGDMYNDVVELVNNVYGECGYTTLRFNFRGVGGSSGIHDNGIGEREDVLGALDFLRVSGMSTLHLVGYSFGAWVNAHLSNLPTEVKTMVAVSPPVSFLDHSKVETLPLLQYVVAGKNDQFAAPDLVDKCCMRWNAQADCDFIEGCDHFYSGNLSRLKDLLAGFLSTFGEEK